jgi:flagellar M-ring protein FliF
MSELVPIGADASPSLLTPLTDPAGGGMLTRLGNFAGQPPVKRMLPWFAGVSTIGIAALVWVTMSPAPQRVLYAQLEDGERAGIVEALDKGAINYTIDNATGALSVAEDDVYRARMLVAQDGALATPESGQAMLDSLPMGASRALEGERLRAARERELELTINEIDGVEAVRVHLAEGEKSVFIRDNAPPTASVMVRLARGRQLSDSQVSAIVSLLAASVPGLSIDSVRVADQHGRLLSDKTSGESDRLELQARMEDKLRLQVAALLTPMLGEGNFSSEIQVELDMDQVTSARESYDKDGVVRSETQAQSTSSGTAPAAGIPGALSNTPPPPTTATAGPPQGTPAVAATTPSNGENTSSRTYELGREVAVANTTPGKLKRLSVAVALSSGAVKNLKSKDIDQLKQLVSAAVGANPARGDQVAVIARSFKPVIDEAMPFYETPWFATILRNVVALITVLLVLLLGVRPLIKALRGKPATNGGSAIEAASKTAALPKPSINPLTGAIDPERLSWQVSRAQRLVDEKPEDAVIALRQMLTTSEAEAAA